LASLMIPRCDLADERERGSGFFLSMPMHCFVKIDLRTEGRAWVSVGD
jgi:hypothetical protein